MANSSGGGGNASGIRAGRAFVELGVSDKGLFAGLDRAAAAVKGFGARIAGGGFGLIGAGLSVLGPLGAAFGEMVEHFSQINDAADRLSTTTENVSALAYAAEQSGASLEDLEAATKNLYKSAAEGGKTVPDLVAAYHDLAEELAGIDDPAAKSARALDVLGKNGLKLLPMLKDGAAGFDKLIGRAARVGDVVSEKDAARADRAGDAMLDVWKSIRNTIRSIPLALLDYIETIEEVTDRIVDGLAAVRAWVKEHAGLVIGVTAAAAALVVLGGAVVGVGGAITVAGVALGGFAALASALVAVALTPVGIFLGLAAAAAAFVAVAVYFPETLQAILTPLSAVVAQAIFASDAFKQAAAGLRAALQPIIDFARELWGVFQTTWGGILDALQAGDLELAAAIAFAGLDVAWKLAVVKMQSAWDDFKHFFIDGWKSARLLFETSLNDAVAFFAQAWIKVLKLVNTHFHKTFTEVLKGMASIADVFGDKELGGALRFLADQKKDTINAVLGAAGKKIEEQRQKEENRLNAEAGIGGAAEKSPALIAAEKELAKAKQLLDDLAGEAAVAAAFAEGGKGKNRLGDIITPGLTRGTFATRGFGAQAFGGTEAKQLKAAEKQVGLLEQIRDGIKDLADAGPMVLAE